MSRSTLVSLGVFIVAIGLAAWLLVRSGSSTSASEGEGPSGGEDDAAGLAFAEWSVYEGAVLLADIDPGAHGSTTPRRFVVMKLDTTKGPHLIESGSYSWAPDARITSTSSLSELGFRVRTDGLAYDPPEDPLFSDPIARVDGGTEQTVVLRNKAGAHVAFTRNRRDPNVRPFWNRRAIGFPSSQSRWVYVTPDAIVLPGPTP